MKNSYHNIRFAGVAAVVPTTAIDNEVYRPILGDKTFRRQSKVTGLKSSYRVANGQNAVDLALLAAQRLMTNLQWHPEDIKVLIYASSYTEYAMPSTAFLLQKHLGIAKDCLVFDVNTACSGTLNAAGIAASLLQQCPNGAKALIVAGVTPSLHSEKEVKEVPLFGDAGTVWGMECAEGFRMEFEHFSDGNGLNILHRRNDHSPTEMDGVEMFQFSVNAVPDSICEFVKDIPLTLSELDYILLHQTHKYILDKITELCDFPAEKVLTSYEKFSNTSTCSIPVTMCHHYEKFADLGRKKLLFSAYGGGLAWTNAYVETENLQVLPVLFSDERVVKDDE